MQETQGVAALRRLIEDGFGKGDLGVVDEVVDENLLEHQPGIVPSDREGVRRAIRFLHRAFPDLRVGIQHLVADGDMVWCHFTARGTNSGPFGHLPPTGRMMEIDVIDIVRIRDGRIVEHWGVPDRFTQAEQLGLLPDRPVLAGEPARS
jgi:predicted ester cyclase